MKKNPLALFYKAADKRIEKLFTQKCSNIQVDIMDLVKITETGRKAITDNQAITDDELGKVIYDFVQTIRKN